MVCLDPAQEWQLCQVSGGGLQREEETMRGLVPVIHPLRSSCVVQLELCKGLSALHHFPLCIFCIRDRSIFQFQNSSICTHAGGPYVYANGSWCWTGLHACGMWKHGSSRLQSRSWSFQACSNQLSCQVNQSTIDSCNSAKKELEKACEPLKLKKPRAKAKAA